MFSVVRSLWKTRHIFWDPFQTHSEKELSVVIPCKIAYFDQQKLSLSWPAKGYNVFVMPNDCLRQLWVFWTNEDFWHPFIRQPPNAWSVSATGMLQSALVIIGLLHLKQKQA